MYDSSGITVLGRIGWSNDVIGTSDRANTAAPGSGGHHRRERTLVQFQFRPGSIDHRERCEDDHCNHSRHFTT